MVIQPFHSKEDIMVEALEAYANLRIDLITNEQTITELRGEMRSLTKQLEDTFTRDDIKPLFNIYTSIDDNTTIYIRDEKNLIKFFETGIITDDS